MSKKKLNRIVSPKVYLEIELYRLIKVECAKTDAKVSTWIKNAILEKLHEKSNK